MRILPVISRELRAQARQPFTHWLRMLGVTVVLVWGLLFAFQNQHTSNMGGVIFGQIHRSLFWAIWLLVPFSAADCISRERREGTLGLLFLTPLKPRDIVVAKGFAHGFRAMTLLLAVLPAMTIPFLMGGVSWNQVVMVALVEFTSICWALGAALVASSIAKDGLRAMILAVVLAGVAFFLSTMLTAQVAFSTGAGGGGGLGRNLYGYVGSGESGFLIGLFILGASNLEMWNPGLGVPITLLAPLALLSVMAVIGLLVLFASIVFSGIRIRHSWKEEPPSARMNEFEKTFLKPVVWVGFFKRWMQRKLDKNPIGWLEQRTWSGRTVSWAWLAVIVLVYSLVLSDNHLMSGFGNVQSLMAWLLALTIAATSAASFRRERENGVLELLLVSPLSASEIVQGRLGGLWGQFLPSCVAMLGIWTYSISIFSRTYSYAMHGEGFVKVWFFAATFLVVPMVGLYFSVRCRNFISALLLTLSFSMVLPMISAGVVCKIDFIRANQINYDEPHEMWRGIYYGTPFIQGIVGFYLISKLKRRLNERSFPLDQTI